MRVDPSPRPNRPRPEKQTDEYLHEALRGPEPSKPDWDAMVVILGAVVGGILLLCILTLYAYFAA